jgi:hypothetical protein
MQLVVLVVADYREDFVEHFPNTLEAEPLEGLDRYFQQVRQGAICEFCKWIPEFN